MGISVSLRFTPPSPTITPIPRKSKQTWVTKKRSPSGPVGRRGKGDERSGSNDCDHARRVVPGRAHRRAAEQHAPERRQGVATRGVRAAHAEMRADFGDLRVLDRKSTRLNSSHLVISY